MGHQRKGSQQQEASQRIASVQGEGVEQIINQVEDNEFSVAVIILRSEKQVKQVEEQPK